jgi:hypothetical protein
MGHLLVPLLSNPAKKKAYDKKTGLGGPFPCLHAQAYFPCLHAQAYFPCLHAESLFFNPFQTSFTF